MENKGNENGVIYAPYITETYATYINGIKVWDKRWWVNIWCRINWFFHFKRRKNWNKTKDKQVSPKFYQQLDKYKGQIMCANNKNC